MTLPVPALDIIKGNLHMAPAMLQNLLMSRGYVVAIAQLYELMAAMVKNQAEPTVTSPKGYTVLVKDLDTIVQYALAAGMPRTYLKD